jgi:hypothetical protein
MGYRFRRSIKILPGIRVNFSRSGVSTTVGVRGAHSTYGKGKTQHTVGIPGTGISYTSTTSRQHGASATPTAACRECKKMIPASADACPFCAVKRPVRRSHFVLYSFAICAVLMMVLWKTHERDGPSHAAAVTVVTPKATAAASATAIQSVMRVRKALGNPSSFVLEQVRASDSVACVNYHVTNKAGTPHRSMAIWDAQRPAVILDSNLAFAERWKVLCNKPLPSVELLQR